jgi:hypothetical protein
MVFGGKLNTNPGQPSSPSQIFSDKKLAIISRDGK